MGTESDEDEQGAIEVLDDLDSQESTLNSLENNPPIEDEEIFEAEPEIKKNRFKKYPNLENYFDIVRIRGKIHTACKLCKSRWTSRSSQRLLKHHNECGIPRKLQTMKEESDKEQDSADTIRNKLFARVIVENNLPMKLVESKSFKSFVAYICRRWQLPTRQELSSIYVPKLARILQMQFNSDVKKGRLNYLSIEFDHWTDATNRSYLGVIATSRSGNRHLIDLRDVSVRGHKTVVIVEDLVEILESIPPGAINSIISDSAANCKKARQDLLSIENYKGCIQHRCLAHLLNNIGSRITTKNKPIADTLKKATMITSMIRGSFHWMGYIRDLNENALPTACRVRWYSTITMLSGLIRLKDVILGDIAQSLSKDDKEIIEKFSWSHVQEILEVLSPLNRCIGVVERKGISLGEAFNAILLFAKDLFMTSRQSDTLWETRNSFLWYFSPIRFGENEFSLLLAAYSLDRRYKINFINQNGIYLALLSIARIAIASKITMKRIESSLNEDFERYRQFEDEFGTGLDDEDQVKWWTDRVSSGILSKVGIRAAHLKATSANIERTFSTIKYIQGNSRMRLLPNTLLELAQLKISYIDESEDDELELNFDRKLQPAATKDPEDASQTDFQSQSLNNSASSTDSSLAIDDPRELHDLLWLENQDITTKRDYQAFFKYIDFTVVNEPKESDLAASDDVTEDHLVNYIRSIKANNKKKQRVDPNVIVEACTDDIVYLDDESSD